MSHEDAKIRSIYFPYGELAYFKGANCKRVETAVENKE